MHHRARRGRTAARRLAALALALALAAPAVAQTRHGAVVAPVRDRLGDILDPETGLSVSLIGEVSVDAGAFAGDTPPNAGDALVLRRAKLGVEGRLHRRIGYRIKGDVTPDGFGVTDSYLVWRGPLQGAAAAARIGHFKPVAGFEAATPARFLSFLERSGMGQAFGPSNRLGLALDLASGPHTLSLGAFGPGLDAERRDGSGEMLSARLATERRAGDVLTLLGATLRGHFTELGDSSLRFKSSLPLKLDTPAAVDTGEVGDTELHVGLDASRAVGPSFVSAEVGVSALSLRSRPGRARLWGATLEAGAWLTGEIAADSLGPTRRRQTLAEPAVGDGGWGALQIVAGLDHVDLADRPVRGGRMTSTRLALNWWPREHLRLTLQGSVSLVDPPGATGSDAVAALGLRAQADF